MEKFFRPHLGERRKKSWKGCKPNFVFTASGGENHLSIATLPGAVTVSDRRTDHPWPPIWPCTRWGLPCRLTHVWRGGLLPHLFTLTAGEPVAVYSLWHFPSVILTNELPACIPD